MPTGDPPKSLRSANESARSDGGLAAIEQDPDRLAHLLLTAWTQVLEEEPTLERLVRALARGHEAGLHSE
jgi:hypothetical protein